MPRCFGTLVLILLWITPTVNGLNRLPSWYGTVRRHHANVTRSPTNLPTPSFGNFTVSDTLTLSQSPDRTQSLSPSIDPSMSSSRGTLSTTRSSSTTLTRSVTATESLPLPEIPVPFVDPIVVASLVSSSFAVSTLSAVLFRSPVYAATDLQLLVAFSMSPCANESVRMTFAWAEPILLGVPLDSAFIRDLTNRGADVQWWAKGTLVFTTVVVVFAAIACLGWARWRKCTARASMEQFRFPGIPLVLCAWLLLPVWVFVGSRLALFPPDSTVAPFPSTRTTSGTVVGALMLVLAPLMVRGSVGCVQAARQLPYVVEYAEVFHDGFGRNMFPRVMWSRNTVHATVGHAIDFAVPSAALMEVVTFAMRTIVVSFLLSVDVTALNLVVVKHCRFFIGGAAALMLVWPFVCFAAYRGPSRHPWAALCTMAQGLFCGATMACQVEYTWLKMFGSAFIFATILVLCGTSVCVVTMWAVERFLWIPMELKRRGSPQWKLDEEGPKDVPLLSLSALLEFAAKLPSTSPRRVTVVDNPDSPRNPFTRLV